MLSIFGSQTPSQGHRLDSASHPADCRIATTLIRDFLHRLKLKEDLDEAVNAKVKRDYSDKEGPIPNFAKLVEDCKKKVVGKARGYLVYLLEKLLEHHSINAEIVKGMASFGPHIFLSLPLEQATHCYTALYNSFHLRGWLKGTSEDDCRDEYH